MIGGIFFHFLYIYLLQILTEDPLKSEKYYQFVYTNLVIMYFSPIILSPFQPYFYNYIPQSISLPEILPTQEVTQSFTTLTCAAKNFSELLFARIKTSELSLRIDYMNLNQKYSSIGLQSKEEFINFYNNVINRYKITYGNLKVKYSWSQQDITMLIWIVNWLHHQRQVHPIDFSKQDWALVSSLIPFRSSKDCMYKWLSMRTNQLQEFPWTKQQKTELANLVQSNSEVDWVAVSKNLFEKYSKNFRTPKQCKESWSIILSSRFQKSKKFWSLQEDTKLLKAFSKFGRKWKHIASLIQGRSENAIKNRFTLLSQKYCKKEVISKNDKDLIQIVQLKLMEEATQSSNNL